jgi:hypothetical protein
LNLGWNKKTAVQEVFLNRSFSSRKTNRFALHSLRNREQSDYTKIRRLFTQRYVNYSVLQANILAAYSKISYSAGLEFFQAIRWISVPSGILFPRIG